MRAIRSCYRNAADFLKKGGLAGYSCDVAPLTCISLPCGVKETCGTKKGRQCVQEVQAFGHNIPPFCCPLGKMKS